jgi:tetratricopeptide (TPR) repeat protein
MNLRIPRTLLAAFVLIAVSFPLRAQVAWVAKFDDALRQAKAEGKLIVVDLSASWCPPCQQMAREVYPDKRFIDFSRSQVFMLLDGEKDNEGFKLTAKYNVNSYPTLLVLNSLGQEVDRLVGGRNTTRLIEELKEIFSNGEPLEQVLNRARTETADFKIQFLAGQRSFNRQDYARARQFLGRAAGLPGSKEDKIQALVTLAAAAQKDRKFKEALDAVDELARTDARFFESSSELRLLHAQLLVSLNRHEDAYREIKDLLRSSSSNKQDAKEVLLQMPAKYRKGDKDFENAVKKAQESLKKQKFDEAMDHAAKAEAVAPQDPQVHLLLAAIHFQSSAKEPDAQKKSGLLTSGLHELRLARRLEPEDLASWQSAKSYLASRYIRFEPNSPEGRKSYAEAEARFNESNFQQAMAAYAKTLQLDPDFGKAYLYLGDCFFRLGRTEEALKSYQQAIAKSPLDASAYRFAADVLRKLGRNDEVTQYSFASLLADPEYPMIWKGARRHADVIPLEFLLLGYDIAAYNEKLFDLVPTETAAAWREYARNKILWREQKYPEAFKTSQFYTASFEEDFDCLNLLVEKWNSMKAQDSSLQNESLDFLSQVAADRQLDSFVYLELFTEEYRPSYERWKQQNMDKATNYIRRYLLGGAQPAARGAAAGMNSAAIDALNSGVTSHRAGDLAKAEELYLKALELQPGMPQALGNLGGLYLQRGDKEKARAAIENLLQLQPQSAMALSLSAQLNAQEGYFESAAELFRKAAEVEQRADAKAMYLKNAENMKAILAKTSGSNVVSKVVVAPPPSPLQAAADALNNEKFSDAIAILEKLYPTLADGSEKNRVELMLGIAHFNSGNLKEARVYVTRLLAKDPANATAQDLLKAIDKKWN